MRIIFMGTPEFAATILEDVISHHEVVAVYTRADAVRGRGNEKEFSPVKKLAVAHEIVVHTPKTLRDEAVQEQIRAYNPDVICVASYGLILPKEVLEIPKYGCLNVHASLLPSWRGAAPVERSILSDEKETGVCVMRMEEGLDTGDFSICRVTNVEEKTRDALTDELANLGSHALLTALVHLQEGYTEWTKQEEENATYAEKIEKTELYISPDDFTRDAVLKVRASSSAHPSKCMVGTRSVTVIAVHDISNDATTFDLVRDIKKGQVLFVHKRLFFGASDGAFEVTEIKPDGKSSMDARAFAAGVQGIKQGAVVWSALNV